MATMLRNLMKSFVCGVSAMWISRPEKMFYHFTKARYLITRGQLIDNASNRSHALTMVPK